LSSERPDWSAIPLSIVYTLEENSDCEELLESHKSKLEKVLQLSPHFFKEHFNLTVKTGVGFRYSLISCIEFSNLIKNSMFYVSMMRHGDSARITESISDFETRMNSLHGRNVRDLPKIETIYYPMPEGIGNKTFQVALIKFSGEWLPSGNIKRNLIVQIPGSIIDLQQRQAFSIVPDFSRPCYRGKRVKSDWFNVVVTALEAHQAGFRTIVMSYG